MARAIRPCLARSARLGLAAGPHRRRLRKLCARLLLLIRSFRGIDLAALARDQRHCLGNAPVCQSSRPTCVCIYGMARSVLALAEFLCRSVGFDRYSSRARLPESHTEGIGGTDPLVGGYQPYATPQRHLRSNVLRQQISGRLHNTQRGSIPLQIWPCKRACSLI